MVGKEMGSERKEERIKRRDWGDKTLTIKLERMKET